MIDAAQKFNAEQISTLARIDLSALLRNIRRIREALPADARLISVVKADAYGLGLTRVVPFLEAGGADAFAIATVAEAAAIREAGSHLPVLLLSPLPKIADQALVDFDIQPTLSEPAEIERFVRLAVVKGEALAVHVKIDTGMGRLGVWHENAADLIDTVLREPRLNLKGIYTHFASADSEPAFAKVQLERFTRVLDQMEGCLPRDLWLHAENSAGWLEGLAPMATRAVRIGILQQGILPTSSGAAGNDLFEPVFSLTAPIMGWEMHAGKLWARIRAGYAHGVPSRAAEHEGRVLIAGQFARMRPPIAAYSLLVECPDRGLGEIPEEERPVVATLIGSEQGARLSVADFAASACQRKWETLCYLIPHARRVYEE